MSWKRKTAVAGTFYPEDPAELRDALAECSKNNDQASLNKVTAIFAPHAGYVYSGRFAAYVYDRIKVPDRVFILCPNHTGRGTRISVWSEGSWETPLGEVEIDQSLAESFLSCLGEGKRDREAHYSEHANEVQVPFLLQRNPKVKIVPIVLGPLSYETCVKVGHALAKSIATQQQACLIVASTDMSHFISAEAANKKDTLALDQIRAFQPEGLYRTVTENQISMCGYIPTTCALIASKELGASEAEVLSYGHSGEVTSDFGSVVAYASGWVR